MENNLHRNNLNNIAYFPGCSLNSTAIDFNVSTQKLFKLLEIKFEEIKDWNCCGTTPAHNISDELSITLAARNLLLAKKMGYDDIVCPCVSCYCKLLNASKYLNSNSELDKKNDMEMKNKVTSLLKDMGFDTAQFFNFRVYSIVEFLLIQKDKIKQKYLELQNLLSPDVRTNAGTDLLKDLNPVCYYGCVLLRPRDIIKFDNVENPMSMENILNQVGINCLDFRFKTECCGAILSLTNKDIVLGLSKEILEAAVEAGANSIIVCCPLCQQNLDLRQVQINKSFKTNYKIPVFYITQILGLSLGLSIRDVMADRLFVEPDISGCKAKIKK